LPLYSLLPTGYTLFSVSVDFRAWFLMGLGYICRTTLLKLFMEISAYG
jgi:hypothetical protein